MRKFEIEMDIHFTKTVHVEAPDEDAAVTLAETMLMCTDALPLTDEEKELIFHKNAEKLLNL